MTLGSAFWRKWILAVGVAFLAFGGLVAEHSRAIASEESFSVRDQLRRMFEPLAATGVTFPAVLELEGAQLALHDALIPFYRQRGYRPVWFRDGQVSIEARQWMEHVQGIAAEGVDPSAYHVETLTTCLELIKISRSYGGACETDGLTLVDLLLTDAFLKYASHLLEVRMDPVRIAPASWHSSPAHTDAASLLRQVLQTRQVDAVLDELLPYRAGYRRLSVYLAYYRMLALDGGWPVFPEGPPVRRGDRDARVPALRRFLVLVGDLEKAREASGRLMDRWTVKALKRFQARHGLRPDGVLGKDTLAQLNVPVARRIEQLSLNLERERQPLRAAKGRYLQVDITDFSLKVVDGGREIMRMPVVVGTSFRRTPVFSSLMTYLVFAPYWTVPPTILEEDKLPLLKADPSYLTSHHYEIVAWGKDPDRIIDAATINWKTVTAETFPGMLRQKPGPWNPLGKVKFMFPNAYHVYLHDTPAHYLFQKQQRTFSSGCIRIARPLELAIYLLEGQKGWSQDRIEEEMQGTKPYTVRLKRPIPVCILYRTAWVDAQGRLQFRNDVYQQDPDLRAALQQRTEVSKSTSGMTSHVVPGDYGHSNEAAVRRVR